MGPLRDLLQARFGRRAGWVRHQLAVALDLCGAFDQAHRVDFSAARRLVFVCQGNICRSAYAQARAELLGLRAASFGLDARAGDPAHPLAAQRAALRGVDLSRHRATPADPRLFGPGDLLLAMEPAHLARLTRFDFQPVTLLGLWATPPRPHLEDPYGLCPEYFDTCFDLIDSALAHIAQRARRARAA